MGRRREAFEEPHGRNVRGPEGTIDQQEKNQAEDPNELIEAAVSTVQVVQSQHRQKRCVCQYGPSKRHRHYFEWNYEPKGKSFNLRLQPEEETAYQNAVAGYQNLKSLLNPLERLSRTAVVRLARTALANSRGI